VTLWNPASTVLPRRRELGIQAVALLALAWGAVYLGWRLGWTGRGAQPVWFVVLVAAELLGWVNLAFYAFLAWRVPDTSPVPTGRHRTVDVVVPTYDESVDVLRATLLTGLLPLRGPIVLFAVLWVPWLALSLLATRLLGRGTCGPVIATRHGWLTMGICTTATLSLLFPGVGRFKVTPNQGVDEGGLCVLTRLRLLTAGLVALLAAAVARALQVGGVVELRPMPGLAEVATLVIAAVELTIICLVFAGVVRRRQRRVAHRFPTEVGARIADTVAVVADHSGQGAGLVLSGEHEPGERLDDVLRLPGLDGELHEVTVRSTRPMARRDGAGPGSERPQRVGVEFTRVGPEARDRLLEYCHVLLPATRSPAVHDLLLDEDRVVPQRVLQAADGVDDAGEQLPSAG
jgi:hypothetical protein